MSNPSSANRWLPFTCPSCQGLFRLRKSDQGRAGRCPVCQAVVRASVETEVAQEPQKQVSETRQDLLSKVAKARPMTPEEIEAHRQAKGVRKKHMPNVAKERVDWEENVQLPNISTGSWKKVFSLMMTAFLVGAGVIYYFNYLRPGSRVVETNQPDQEKTEALLNSLLQVEQASEDGDEESGELEDVNKITDEDIANFTAAFDSFLNAPTAEDRLAFIRHRDRVGAVMSAYYDTNGYKAEGFRKLVGNYNYSEGVLRTQAELSSFTRRDIVAEKVMMNDEVSYLIDWESWVGYGEFSPDEMKEQKPKEPFLVRVFISEGNYYNYEFSDDREWSAYSIVFLNSHSSFLGYAPRDSDLDKGLKGVLRNRQSAALTLKVAYPAEARAEDLFEIRELVNDSWTINEQEDKSNE